MPSQYVKRTVTVAATPKTVSVVCGGKRIAIHGRALRKGDHRTNPEHMPDAHRDYAEWDGNRFRRWAAEVGESTGRATDAALASRKVEQQSCRSCRGVLALSEAHGKELLGEACAKALLRTPRPSYKTVKDTIAALAKEHDEADGDGGAYLRGGEHYERIDGIGDEPKGDEE